MPCKARSRCAKPKLFDLGDVEAHRLDAVERYALRVAWRRVDLPRAGREQLARKRQTEAAVCAGDEGDRVMDFYL